MQTIKQYVLDNFEPSEIQDICQHGMVSGFGNLIYYSQTVEFYDLHSKAIWDMVYEDAYNQGVTALQLIASFNGQENVITETSFKNMMCWYSIERVCADLYAESQDNYYTNEHSVLIDKRGE